MKNSNVLNFRELHNRGIVSKCKNFDLLSDFLLEEYSEHRICSSIFSVIGFDFGEDGFVRQLQPMVDYDFLEVFSEAQDKSKYGDHFCILHHDFGGFHYLVF